MYWQPGQAFWEAYEKDEERVEGMRKKLSNKSSIYLQEIVDAGNPVRRTLALRSFLKKVNPFNYGLSMIYEPYKRYEIAKELLAEKSLKGKSKEALRQIANLGLVKRIIWTKKERLEARVARGLLASKK